MNSLFAADALLPSGWAKNVLLAWNEDGELTRVETCNQAPDGMTTISGPLIPGMPNLHSHAFQRATAGFTEYRSKNVGETEDNFWSWRELMYRFASRLGPEQLEAIAFWVYVEMLEAGYTSVCEFHYLHNNLDGQSYADDATLAFAIMRAAQRAGIGLTLLPVLYQTSGLGGLPPNMNQRRFVRSTDSMLKLLDRLKPLCDKEGVRLGLAPHSLRAVPPNGLREALAGLDAIDVTAPIHIHIAEQTKEVSDCIAWSGQRPVAWLLDHAPVDARWCLVHATHMDADEYRRAGASGAVAGLCPTTEANLGDGIFNLPAWRKAGGVWGIGSDSHICVNVAEELLMLEYSQRLSTRQRNVAADAAQPQVATAMMLTALRGGAQAVGRPVGGLAVGQQADFVMLNGADTPLSGLPAIEMLSSHVFASHRTSAIAKVWVAGYAQVDSGGRHKLHASALNGFVTARRQLLEAP
jgi:formimidoylglutamate deiminase